MRHSHESECKLCRIIHKTGRESKKVKKKQHGKSTQMRIKTGNNTILKMATAVPSNDVYTENGNL